MLVGGLADLAGELKVVADEIRWIDFESLLGVAVREVEHLRQFVRDSPELARKQVVD